MSLQPQPPSAVPEETARIAQAAFPRGHRYLRLRDTFGPLFDDARFAPLFAPQGQPALSPARLALVTLLQFAEGLSDRDAADAVRGRVEWKYLLGLELTDPGFDFSGLSEFRARLIAGNAEALLFDTLLEQFRAHRLLGERGRQRTDSTHVLAGVRQLNRLELVHETLRQALETLALVAPAWLREHLTPAWGERYGERLGSFGNQRPADHEAFAATIGSDGAGLYQALWSDPAHRVLVHSPALETLRRVWLQQYHLTETTAGLSATWRTAEDRPSAGAQIQSPYDRDARYADKGATAWVGYKTHLTETCEPDAVQLIVQVEPTAAAQPDRQALAPIQQELVTTGRRPTRQFVDSGYVDGQTLQASAAQGIELVGPTLPGTSWQQRTPGGLTSAQFTVDWEAHQVHCPADATSVAWRPATDAHGAPVVKVAFAPAACQSCSQRPQCTTAPARRLTLRVHAEHAALVAARARERTAGFWQAYARRAGIEGTISQAVRACGLRRSRYRGFLKTRLQQFFVAAAINLVRVADWLAAPVHATTRTTRLTRLLAVPRVVA